MCNRRLIQNMGSTRPQPQPAGQPAGNTPAPKPLPPVASAPIHRSCG